MQLCAAETLEEIPMLITYWKINAVSRGQEVNDLLN
jgi:hypothetical protein